MTSNLFTGHLHDAYKIKSWRAQASIPKTQKLFYVSNMRQIWHLLYDYMPAALSLSSNHGQDLLDEFIEETPPKDFSLLPFHFYKYLRLKFPNMSTDLNEDLSTQTLIGGGYGFLKHGERMIIKKILCLVDRKAKLLLISRFEDLDHMSQMHWIKTKSIKLPCHRGSFQLAMHDHQNGNKKWQEITSW